MRMLHVMSPRRTPSRSRLVNCTTRVYPPSRRRKAGPAEYNRPRLRSFRRREPSRGASSMRYVVLGNGVCGIEAALALRARDAEARISIVSDENAHFFSRPALMYVFAGQLRLQDTEPYDRGLYERMRFERVSARVSALDTGARTLVLEGGGTLDYDRLLLAVGSVARPAPWPGAAGQGVHAFVTLRDLERLETEARPGQRAVVIGGGLIGVEVAEILHAR